MNFEKIFEEAVNLDASDIHLTAGQEIFLRVSGELLKIDQIVTVQDFEKFFEEIFTQKQREKLERERSIDFSLVSEKFSRRFRVNIYYQR